MPIVADALFCDDIRQEVTGKFIFIGVYPGDLVPGVVPSTFSMGVMVRVYGLPPGAYPFEMTLTSPTGKTVFEKKDSFDLVNPNAPMVLVFAGFPMPIEGPGEIVASINIGGEDLIAGKLAVVLPA